MDGSHSIIHPLPALQPMKRRCGEPKLLLPCLPGFAGAFPGEEERIQLLTRAALYSTPINAIVLDHESSCIISEENLQPLSRSALSLQQSTNTSTTNSTSLSSYRYFEHNYAFPNYFYPSNRCCNNNCYCTAIQRDAALNKKARTREEEKIVTPISQKSRKESYLRDCAVQEPDDSALRRIVFPSKRKAEEQTQSGQAAHKIRRTSASTITDDDRRIPIPAFPIRTCSSIEKHSSLQRESKIAATTTVTEKTSFISLETPQSIGTQVRKLEEEHKGRLPVKRKESPYEKKVKFEATNRKGGLLDTPEPYRAPSHACSVWNLHNGS